MLGKRIGLDLGSSSLRVVVRGEGQISSEPSLVARHRQRGYSAAGAAAAELAGEPQMEMIRPIRGWAVADREALASLLQRAVNRAAGRQRIFRPDVVIAVSPPMSGADRLAILEICARLGTRTAYLIDSPMAAALGAGHSLVGPRAHLVADLGAGTVDVACVAAEGTLAGRSLSCAGESLRLGIARRLEELHGVAVDAATAEEVVSSLACVGAHEERRLPIRSPWPDRSDTVSIASTEIADLVDEHARRVGGLLREVLDQTPAVLRREILAEGVTLCGGGARLEGLDRNLGAQLGCPARVAADPPTCVIRGAQTAVENLDVLKRSFVYIR
jgi:rod shape-determining protein MreB